MSKKKVPIISATHDKPYVKYMGGALPYIWIGTDTTSIGFIEDKNLRKLKTLIERCIERNLKLRKAKP